MGLARAIFSVARGMKTSKALKWINFHAAATTFHPLTMTTAEDPLREISITTHFSSPHPPNEPHPMGSGEPGPDQEVEYPDQEVEYQNATLKIQFTTSYLLSDTMAMHKAS